MMRVLDCYVAVFTDFAGFLASAVFSPSIEPVLRRDGIAQKCHASSTLGFGGSG